MDIYGYVMSLFYFIPVLKQYTGSSSFLSIYITTTHTVPIEEHLNVFFFFSNMNSFINLELLLFQTTQISFFRFRF